MRTRLILSTEMLVVGMALGWLVGSERMKVDARDGPSAAAASAPVQPTTEPVQADPPAGDGKKPNIVFILMDNLGYGEVGCYSGGILRGASDLISPRTVRIIVRRLCRSVEFSIYW
jgi:hypothetical protein